MVGGAWITNTFNTNNNTNNNTIVITGESGEQEIITADDYEQIKKEREEHPPHNNIPVQAPETKEEKDPEPTTAQKKSFRNWIASFFGKAPSDGGAALDW